jgi:hypothetical protein
MLYRPLATPYRWQAPDPDAICAVPEFQPDVAFAAVLVRDKTPGVRLICEWLAMGAARNLASNRRDHRRGHVAKIGSAG